MLLQLKGWGRGEQDAKGSQMYNTKRENSVQTFGQGSTKNKSIKVFSNQYCVCVVMMTMMSDLLSLVFLNMLSGRKVTFIVK